MYQISINKKAQKVHLYSFEHTEYGNFTKE